jgi:hypothetical protein
MFLAIRFCLTGRRAFLMDKGLMAVPSHKR